MDVRHLTLTEDGRVVDLASLNRAHERFIDGAETFASAPPPVMRDGTAIALCLLIAVVGFLAIWSIK